MSDRPPETGPVGVAPDDFVPIAVTSRSEFDESVHWGAAVVVGADGATSQEVGRADVRIYPRSSLKPVQAAAMVESGLDVPDDLLALVCASHDGSPQHVDGVRRLLATAGLDESALRTTPALPYDRAAAAAVLRAGGGPEPILMNCSGKHAGMLVTCVVNGWSLDDHLDVDHPLQQRITAAVAEALGPVAHVGVDGCGAPTHAVSLGGLARGMGRLVAAGGPVPRAMRADPVMVGGPTRPVTRLMEDVDGLVAKDGAEGVFVAAMPDGRAIAVKVADGAARAVPPVVLALLPELGVPDPVVARLAAELDQVVHGHGRPVGRVRSLIGR